MRSSRICARPLGRTTSWASPAKAHPVIGANLLSNVPMLERIRPIVLSHHERFDGTGYPQGLRADKIPLAATGLADVPAAVEADDREWRGHRVDRRDAR